MMGITQGLKWWQRFMANGKDLSALLGGILLGILGGIVAAAIINALAEPKCPGCQRVIQQGVPTCPHCGTFLQWGNQ